LIDGLLEVVKQDDLTKATLEVPYSKASNDQLDILKGIQRNSRDPRVFSRKRKQKRSQTNLSNPRSIKNSRRLRSGITAAPQQDSQSSLHQSSTGLHSMAPRFFKSPSGKNLNKSKEFAPDPLPAAISARYLKMKKKEEYLRGSIEKDSRVSSQSPRPTKVEQLCASMSQNSGLHAAANASSVQHSYTLQHQLKIPKQKIGLSGMNSSSNPNLAASISSAVVSSKPHTSKAKVACVTAKDHSALLGVSESACKSWKKRFINNEVPKRQPSANLPTNRNAKSTSSQSQGSSSNLRAAAQVATEAISSQSKLKLTSLFLSNLHSPTQAKTSRDRRNIPNASAQIDTGNGGRMMRLTVTSGKHDAPLVQINNIVGEIKETTQINRGANSSSEQNLLFEGVQNNTNTSTSHLYGRIANPKPRSSQLSKVRSGGKQATHKRSRSRKSPSLEFQSIEATEKATYSPKQPKKSTHYDKQAIASYLQKNRLLNL
jgi:hypothetical protein